MVKALYILGCIFMAAQCNVQKQGGSLENGSQNPLVGNWGLKKAEQYGPNDKGVFQLNEIPLEQLQCTYTFRENGTVSISKDHLAYSKGEYPYQMYEGYLGPEGVGEKVLILEIQNFKWECTFWDHTLKLSLVHLDGPIVYLEKEN